MSAAQSVRMLLSSAARAMRTPTAASVRTRSLATSSTASSSASSSRNWTALATAAITGLAGASLVYATTSPLHNEPRGSYSDRMKSKPKEAAKKKEPEAEPADETPEAIEVAAEEVSEEGQQQSAYNPETGEINWDCPCLGGMAHGPCGEQFKAAFSCFVYSEAEPKGIDCVDKFKLMQDCFREYPEIYKDEIEDDEAAAASSSNEGGESKDDDKKPKDVDAAVGGDKKEGGPAKSGTATVDVDNRGGANPDKVEKDDPERKKREHDVFVNRASSGPTPRG